MFWSACFLYWDYLWRGVNHLTVTGCYACTTDFLLVLFSTNLPTASTTLVDGKTPKQVIWLSDLVIYSSFINFSFLKIALQHNLLLMSIFRKWEHVCFLCKCVHACVCVCLWDKAAGTECYTMQIWLRRTKMFYKHCLFGSGRSQHPEPERTVAHSRDIKRRDPVEGSAMVSLKRLCIPRE